MKIAMIGQKGIPATYGGVERHVEELAVRLVGLGHDVTVYSRPHYVGDRRKVPRTQRPLQTTYYKGVRLVRLPSVSTKHLDAITHVALCTAHAMLSRAEVLHYHAVGPALFSWAPRLVGKKAVVTIHGQDALRPKWGGFARLVLSIGEWMAVKAPHVTICVSETLANKLSEKYGRRVEFVPNGVALNDESDDSIFDELGVEPHQYILFASRLVPEKGCHYLVNAWNAAGRPMPLVMAGDSSFTPDYVRELRASCGDPGVIYPGYVYGARLASLFRNAALFVLPSELEGLPIVLLEALGYGAPVLASDIPPNVEVLGAYGRTFVANSTEDLTAKLRSCLAELPVLKSEALAAQQSILERYNWDTVVGLVEGVYSRVRRGSQQST